MADSAMKLAWYWPDQLTNEERAALDPGILHDLNRRPRRHVGREP